MRILDLFSGTHSLANAARPLGHEVVNLDNALPADIDCDFLTWDYTAYPPGHFDLIAASPPCAVWSNARMMNLGKLRLATGRPWTQAELDADLKGPQGEQLIDRLRQMLDYFQPGESSVHGGRTAAGGRSNAADRRHGHCTDTSAYERGATATCAAHASGQLQ